MYVSIYYGNDFTVPTLYIRIMSSGRCARKKYDSAFEKSFLVKAWRA